MEEKFAKVQEIIAEQLELDPAKITMESSLMEDLEADSLDVIELVMAFEEEFGVKMPDEELENRKRTKLNKSPFADFSFVLA